MKKHLLLTAAMLMVLWAIPQTTDAQIRGGRERDMVCVYQDIQYQGWEQCYAAGDEIIDLRGRRNSISSIRVFGRARILVYDDSEFRGSSDEFYNDIPDLDRRAMYGSRSWNDRIDSFRVGYGFDNRSSGPRNAPPPFSRDPYYNDRQPDIVRNGICVFEHANFRGRSECFDAGMDVRDLGRVAGWNDRITSIRVLGRARAMLYENTAFRGERLVVDHDVSDLAVIRLRDGVNWNDQISSFEVRADVGNGRGRGRGRW